MKIAKRIAQWLRRVLGPSHGDPAEGPDQRRPACRARRWVTLR